MVLFLDHVATAVRDLDGAKRFFGLLGFEVADAVVIQGEQFSRYMGVPSLEGEASVRAAFEGRAVAQTNPTPVNQGAVASAPKRVVLKIVPEKIVSWDHRKLGGRY